MPLIRDPSVLYEWITYMRMNRTARHVYYREQGLVPRVRDQSGRVRATPQVRGKKKP